MKKPCTSKYWFDEIISCIRKISNEEIIKYINNKKTINENERRLYCKSEITFYSPENIEVTRQFTVFYNCSCSMTSRYNYTKEENLEIDKWMLRKISFLRFLEVVNQYRKDRSWHPDSYIDTYWFNIYTDRKRNRIKLG